MYFKWPLEDKMYSVLFWNSLLVSLLTSILELLTFAAIFDTITLIPILFLTTLFVALFICLPLKYSSIFLSSLALVIILHYYVFSPLIAYLLSFLR
jgi:hypothetical protein